MPAQPSPRGPSADTASVSSASSSGSSSAGYQDVESEDGEMAVSIVSLLDDKTFGDVTDMLAHCREVYGFDFVEVCRELQLDFHGAVKLCNLVRRCAKNSQPLPPSITAADLENDELLLPVLEGDGFITVLDNVLEAVEPRETSAKVVPASTDGLAARNRELEAKLAAVTEQFAHYRLAVEETLNKRWGVDAEAEADGGDTTAAAGRQVKAQPANVPAGDDDEYWESYAHNDIHETMLKDQVRTDAYRDFVYGNKDVFRGKVVLDIGCGTGILSMFCAKAGAKRVIAVDKSAIVKRARENIAANGLSDIITCLAGRIEDVRLPVDEVDIIISEWMGYCLLFEAMLPSVLWARDRYLRADGLMVPSVATMWMAPVSDADYTAEYVGFWDDVYGFDMTAMKRSLFADARIDVLPATALCGPATMFRRLDLHETQIADLEFCVPWSSRMQRRGELDGFLVWFDIFFTSRREQAVEPRDAMPDNWADAAAGRVAFTTGPAGTPTHWKQGLLLIERSSKQQQSGEALAEGTELAGDVTVMAQQDDPRALEVRVRWRVPGQAEQQQQTWRV